MTICLVTVFSNHWIGTVESNGLQNEWWELLCKADSTILHSSFVPFHSVRSLWEESPYKATNYIQDALVEICTWPLTPKTLSGMLECSQNFYVTCMWVNSQEWHWLLQLWKKKRFFNFFQKFCSPFHIAFRLPVYFFGQVITDTLACDTYWSSQGIY